MFSLILVSASWSYIFIWPLIWEILFNDCEFMNFTLISGVIYLLFCSTVKEEFLPMFGAWPKFLNKLI